MFYRNIFRRPDYNSLNHYSTSLDCLGHANSNRIVEHGVRRYKQIKIDIAGSICSTDVRSGSRAAIWGQTERCKYRGEGIYTGSFAGGPGPANIHLDDLDEWSAYAVAVAVFFSAYQHLQYIPVIFVGAFLLAIFTLWETRTYRPLLSLLAGLMGVYVALSLSMLAMGFLVLGMLFFFGHSVLSRRQRLSAFTITLVTASILIFSITLTNQELLKEKLGLYNHTPPIARLATDEIESKIDEIVINNSLTAPLEVTETNNAIDTATFATPQNIKERKEYLKVYLNPIIQNPTTLFFGHREPPDRNHYPSAHNYYLDFIYNFGIIAILPLLGLIGFTAYLIFRNFPKILTSSETLGLAGVVLFLVLIDNMFKVGMRQPFPGLMTFFLWGVLLAVLKKLNRPTAR